MIFKSFNLKNHCPLLGSHCREYNVIGFDCEWVTINGSRRPIALMQLATHRGLCALIRLCYLQRVPVELKDLLEDFRIIKVGVVPCNDAKYLSHDYGVRVASTLDLRHLAELRQFKPAGLAKMSITHLNVALDKNWRLACSNWENAQLTDQQVAYAAKDAHVAIELFKVFAGHNRWTRWPKENEMLDDYEVYLNVAFCANKSSGSTAAKQSTNNFANDRRYVVTALRRRMELINKCVS